MSIMFASLAFTVAAQTTGIGTYPGTTGAGQYANAGASGGFYKSGIYASGGEVGTGFGALGLPTTPYVGVDLRAKETLDVDISGVFVATITLQRSLDGGVTWRDVRGYTAPAEDSYQAESDETVRLFCKTGNYTSGSPALLIQKGA